MKKTIVMALAIFLSFSATAQKMKKAQHQLHYNSEKIDGIYIPKDIDDAISVLDTLSNGKIKAFANECSSETDFSGRLHFGLGMWLRNNWGLWRGSRLSLFFDEMGVFHPDDMSGIILDSYYRYVKGQNLDIEGQIEHYKDYWKKYKRTYFQKQWYKFKKRIKAIGKNRNARKELRQSGLIKGHTVVFTHPYGFSSQEEKDMYDKGIFAKGIVKRYKIVGPDAFFEVKLLEAQCPYGIIIYDGNIETDADFVRKPSFNPEDKSIFYMKPGERYWFFLNDKSDDFWEPVD